MKDELFKMRLTAEDRRVFQAVADADGRTVAAQIRYLMHKRHRELAFGVASSRTPEET